MVAEAKQALSAQAGGGGVNESVIDTRHIVDPAKDIQGIPPFAKRLQACIATHKIRGDKVNFRCGGRCCRCLVTLGIISEELVTCDQCSKIGSIHQCHLVNFNWSEEEAKAYLQRRAQWKAWDSVMTSGGDPSKVPGLQHWHGAKSPGKHLKNGHPTVPWQCPPGRACCKCQLRTKGTWCSACKGYGKCTKAQGSPKVGKAPETKMDT
jgi:hypothetical protein